MTCLLKETSRYIQIDINEPSKLNAPVPPQDGIVFQICDNKVISIIYYLGKNF